MIDGPPVVISALPNRLNELSSEDSAEKRNADKENVATVSQRVGASPGGEEEERRYRSSRQTQFLSSHTPAGAPRPRGGGSRSPLRDATNSSSADWVGSAGPVSQAVQYAPKGSQAHHGTGTHPPALPPRRFPSGLPSRLSPSGWQPNRVRLYEEHCALYSPTLRLFDP